MSGLRTIITMEDVLITDYIAVAGIGAAFVNEAHQRGLSVVLAGLNGPDHNVIAVALIDLHRHPVPHPAANGATMVTIGLMSGFALFGKNIANIWPILGGTALYALVQGEGLSRHVKGGHHHHRHQPAGEAQAVQVHAVLDPVGVLRHRGRHKVTGGDLNGATIGAIFTIIGFSGYGKHAFNIPKGQPNTPAKGARVVPNRPAMENTTVSTAARQ